MLFDEPESGVDLENISLVGNSIAELLEKRIDPEITSRLSSKNRLEVKWGLSSPTRDISLII
jgi:Fe-S cluster assembly ATP-binding protein